ncbi:scavenger receptor cysteine-rich type 1 protein M130-like [Amia ocellicauda]|uniref:scavenger receptor cysteine-rich type 1 protein M130-like n=1 Tax=Amia ocellicauda TaxID=2972642 RepID=UPI003463E1D9
MSVCYFPGGLQVRVNSSSLCAGRVEVLFEGQWGHVCSHSWDLRDAEVLCQQLGCGAAVSAPHLLRSQNASEYRVLSRVHCLGNETELGQCRAGPLGVKDSQHLWDAAVICADHREPRIADGEEPCSGRVELQFGDQWGTVCDSDWDLQDASVVCRQLQCGEAVAIPGGARYGEGRGPVWDKRLDCQGPGGPRLVGGESRCSGRVEVLRGALWGSVCDRYLDLQTADVICRHLQCGGAASIPRGAPYGAGISPLWKDRFQCSGSEGRLGDCPLSWHQEDCDQGHVASVVCSKHWRVCLAGRGSQCAGRVEVYHDGAWGSVCDDLWDLADASVVCRQLGCGQALKATGSAEFGEGSGPVWLDDVTCRGNETALWECPRASWKRRNCGHKEDAGVVCSEHKELRLVSAEYDCAGRLEVLYNGTWGSVCSNGMESFTVALVCRQLQCGDSGSLQDGEQFETGSGPKWLDMVKCRGHESVLWQCPAAPWGRNECQDPEEAEIRCARPQLRLVGLDGRCSGMVEVCHRGVWGTVCDDSWDLQDAHVGAQWGEGSGTVWLDEVSCRGTERALLECRSSPPGSHDCTHKEDAAVVCAEDYDDTGCDWAEKEESQASKEVNYDDVEEYSYVNEGLSSGT